MRLRAIALTLLVAAAMLPACGDDSDGDLPIVTIFGPYRGEEAALFMAGLDDWADTQGIDVRYTGSADFASDLQYRVSEVLSPPDIALVPQPGLVRVFVEDGAVVPLSEAVADAVRQHYDETVLDLGRFDDELVGFPFRSNVKSLVWYRPSVVAEFGVSIPRTLDELDAAVEGLVASGVTPWCLGVEAQTATGWPATDWIEDLLVREQGTDVYEDWVAGTVPFADERIAAAFDTFRSLVLQPTHVAGGIAGVLTTSTQSSDDPLFAEPPGCVFFKQASFAYGWMPPGLEVGPDADIDFFVLPAAGADVAPPIVVGADLAVAFTARPEVEAVLVRLAAPEAGAAWAQRGSYLSLRNDVDPFAYHSGADRVVAEVIAESDTIVFDGSDAMSPQVGTTPFWSGITAWISGQRTYEGLAESLDTARGE